ncbi:putative short-chain reductase (plasmid) [Rhizobium tropici CIAT 899]|uniref:3-oxoacyl-[acyl-carrier protein] reductase n=1 Tax=Rhizobium tropici TaxID=398 RepID=A0ABR6QZ07_RHITR|nr:putative short-chain reductase [Rhizobium tropici CIAT 899]MBB4241852.1 3-oxoacyl-[acyl-carrier protein] reductase [Rhizobium tropici]MBB5593501.1 3-oxoacyl-[acyl-carrier protein] reductase [Rhizobium tropici]MBB6492177.1 3-oxoacyl-[acyl-carrier protein] reductase [Rhizobium tropici]
MIAPLASSLRRRYGRIKMFDINVLGLLLATQAAAPHLGEGGSVTVRRRTGVRV